MSPTQRALELAREQGYRAAVVEKWNAFAPTPDGKRRGIRQDLFGFIDVIAIREGETLAIQATSLGNVSDRVKKITGEDCIAALGDVRKAGWRVVIWGFGLNSKRRIVHREVDVS